MSRIGRQTIEVPPKTTVTVNGASVVVAGPLGELTRTFTSDVAVSMEGSTVTVTPKNDSPDLYPIWGTTSAHIANMVAGVNKAYEKKLIVEGVGYRAAVEGQNLVMQLGFSHPVSMAIPKGITCTAEKGIITISGIDKEAVGQFAASIRAMKKPEPYKGKGIRYDDEVIRRKEGKRAA